MFCSNCGREFEGNFCPYCGTAAIRETRETKCPECGRSRGEGELFCPTCGHKFDGAVHNRPISVNHGADYNRSANANYGADYNRSANANHGASESHGNKPNANKRGTDVNNANHANYTDNADGVNKENNVDNAKSVYAGAGAPYASCDSYGKKSFIVNVYSALYYLPAIIFAVFAALLFAFFNASVAGTPAFEILGEKIPAESIGNVYTMIRDCPDVKGLMIALIAVAGVTLVAAIAFLFVALSGKTKTKAIYSGEKRIPYVYVVYIVEAILAAAFIVIGVVVKNKAPGIKLPAEEEFPMEDLIVLEAGACPKLIIAFAIATFVLIIGCLTARSVILAIRPECAVEDWKNSAPPEGVENVELPVSMDEFYIYPTSVFALKNIIVFIIIAILPFVFRYKELIGYFTAEKFNLRLFALFVIGNFSPFFFVCAISCFWFRRIKEMKKNIKLVVIFLVIGLAIAVLGVLNDNFGLGLPEYVAKFMIGVAVVVAAVLIMVGITNFITICKLSGYRKTTGKVLKEAGSLPKRKWSIGETKDKLKKYAVDGDYEKFNAILEEIHNEYKELKEKETADFFAKKNEILAKFR